MYVLHFQQELGFIVYELMNYIKVPLKLNDYGVCTEVLLRIDTLLFNLLFDLYFQAIY